MHAYKNYYSSVSDTNTSYENQPLSEIFGRQSTFYSLC